MQARRRWHLRPSIRCQTEISCLRLGQRPLRMSQRSTWSPSARTVFRLACRCATHPRCPPTRRHAAEQKELVESVVTSDEITSTVLRLDPSLPYVVSVHTRRNLESAAIIRCRRSPMR